MAVARAMSATRLTTTTTQRRRGGARTTTPQRRRQQRKPTKQQQQRPRRQGARKAAASRPSSATTLARLRRALLLRRDVFERDSSTAAALAPPTACDHDDNNTAAAATHAPAAHLSVAECRLRRRPTMLRLQRHHDDDAGKSAMSQQQQHDDDAHATTATRGEPTTSTLPLVAPRAADAPRYTLVLDLDETMVYARDGPLYARAYARELLHDIRDDYEVIVWTAGGREYAKSVLEAINVEHVVAHLVYAHPRWMGEDDGDGDNDNKPMYTKDLRHLGRDMRYTVLVDNTPDCLRANPQNGIHVNDFEVRVGGAAATTTTANAAAATAHARALRDRTLFWLREVLRSLARSGDTVPHFLAHCPLLSRRVLRCVDGARFAAFHLGPRRRRPRIDADDAQASRDTDHTPTQTHTHVACFVLPQVTIEYAAANAHNDAHATRTHAMKLPERTRRPRPDFLVDNAAQLGLGRLFLGWGNKKHGKHAAAAGKKTRATTTKAAAAATKTHAPTPAKPTRARAAPPPPQQQQQKQAPRTPPQQAQQQPPPPTKRPVGRPRKHAVSGDAAPTTTAVAPTTTMPRDPLTAPAPRKRATPSHKRNAVPATSSTATTTPPPPPPPPAAAPHARHIRLSVRLTSGRTFAVALDDDASVDALKAAIAQAMPRGNGNAAAAAAPPSLLVVNGRALMPGAEVLRDLGVTDGAIVYAFPGQA